jgi:beta-lactamase regulating signal transducer with metallopeptidase domain/Tol biopolymer transport system component
LVVGWFAGATIFVLIAVVKALRTECWLRRERKPLQGGLQSEIRGLLSGLGVGISPKLWLLDGVGQPFVWGLLRGGIYLPANLVKANDAELRRGVLGHEFSHVLRFDAAVNLLQIVAQAVFWFHPFVWWTNRRIRGEREKCCDEMAIARLGAKAKDYSDAIVSILISESESTRPVPSLAVAGPVKNIEERIETMLRPGKKFYKHPSLPAATVIVLTALLAVPTTVVLTVRAGNQPTTKSADTGRIFSNPTNLGPTVNSSAREWDPSISADGLELYFKSYRPDGYGSGDIWVTTRKTKNDPWGNAINLGPIINSSYGEGAPEISADGLALYFVSGRPGGSGAWDIWVTSRKTKEDPWGTPVNLGPTVNSSAHENQPSISTDGLTLYFAEVTGMGDRPGTMGEADIWLTKRETKNEPWGTPVNLGPMVNGPDSEAAPSISTDGLSIYFNGWRTGSLGGVDIWVTTRKTKDDPWGRPVNLGRPVNSSHHEYNPDISSDGSTLYFASNRPGTVGGSDDMDIWQVSLKTHAAKE